MTDLKIIELIRKEKYPKALATLYKVFPKVLAYVMQYGGEKSDAEDIFQDSLLICIEKIKADDFSLKSALSTFLIGIAKNKTREYLRKLAKTNQIETEEVHDFPGEINRLIEEEKKYKALDKILIEIGKKCTELLIMFYHKSMNMKQIATKLGFKSETSAKTQKYKCLEKAKQLTAGILVEIQNQSL